MDSAYAQGICTSMCPTKELALREKEGLLHKFEIKDGTECNRRPSADPEKVIKCYQRSAAAQIKTNPAELRPFYVLLKTIKYLFANIFPMHEEKPVTVFNFMFDRLRSVRQDAAIQNLCPNELVCILEPIVRFHIYFSYILSEEDASRFDAHINNLHILECLKQLLVCYDYCSDKSAQEIHTSCWVIEGFYLLFNLGDTEALARGFKKSQSCLNKQYLQCVSISSAWFLRQYATVLKYIEKLPVLMLCAVAGHVPEIRRHSLRVMSYAYSCANSSYPVSHLMTLLLYDGVDDVLDDCRYFNIKTEGGYVNFFKKDFHCNLAPQKPKRLQLVDNKLKGFDIVNQLFIE